MTSPGESGEGNADLVTVEAMRSADLGGAGAGLVLAWNASKSMPVDIPCADTEPTVYHQPLAEVCAYNL